MALTREYIIGTVKALGFPAGEYCVIGSGVLAAHNIRDANDIDFLVTKELFAILRDSGTWAEIFEYRPKLQREGIEVQDTMDVGEYNPDTRSIIERADMIESVPFQSLSDLLDFKRALGNEKDLRDIALIENFMK